jgi:predicted transcriptional regulator
LNTQVTLRIDEGLANRLRELAEERGVPYTSLLREWIEARYDLEVSPASVHFQVEVAGEGETPGLFTIENARLTPV